MNIKNLAKRIGIIALLMTISIISGCTSGRTYTCGLCGKKMSSYYSYTVTYGELCYSCTKIVRG